MTTYKININTSRFVSKNRKTVEMQIHNDICFKLNNMTWEYKTAKGVVDRLKALTGGITTNISVYTDNNLMTIRNELYGKLEVKKALPGICNGFIDWDMLERQLNKDKYVKMPFSLFYEDINIVRNLGLNKCYIEIYKV